MEFIDVIKWVVGIVTPVITWLVGWFTAKRQRDNDFLGKLQSSIDLLSSKNNELMSQIVSLNETVICLRRENGELKSEIGALRLENGQLSDEVGKLRDQLTGIKTITRIKKEND